MSWVDPVYIMASYVAFTVDNFPRQWVMLSIFSLVLGIHVLRG